MSHPSSVSGAFGMPFAEQIAFFRGKLGNLVPTERWDDMVGEAHDTGFMVAGAAEADLLTDLAAAVDKAIAEGRGIEEFRKDFRATVARNGWTGWTGEGSVAGEAWRVKTILRTNAYTSYAAGRYAQLVEGGFPFWVYRHGDSREPRPEHLAMDGVVLRSDDPAWRKWFPPSDWGCSCYVVGARSERGAKRLGGDPSKKLPAAWNAVDPKTGEPSGIGKGWGYAPGASVNPAVRAAAGKVWSWDYRIGKAFLDQLPEAQRDALSSAYRSLPSTADDARRYAKRIWEGRPDPEPGRTLGMMRAEQLAAIGDDMLQLDPRGFDLSLSPSELRHILKAHGDPAEEKKKRQRAVTPDDFGVLPAMIDAAAVRYTGLSGRHQLPAIELAADIDGERYVTIWETRVRRRTFALHTFYIERRKGA